jgi:ferritin-like metal-binding protein YciE
MKMSSLRDLFCRGAPRPLQCWVSAREGAAQDGESGTERLKQAFKEHLEQTRGHVQRIEEIFEGLDGSPKGKKCVGMEGLIA